MGIACIAAAGILYRDMYAANLVGAHVEMRSLEVLILSFPFRP